MAAANGNEDHDQDSDSMEDELYSDYLLSSDEAKVDSGAEWNHGAEDLCSTSNIVVKSLQRKITDCKVQAIVISENTKLSPLGGLAKFLCNTAGDSIWADLQRQAGGQEQKAGTILLTNAGSLREINHIVHIVTPVWGKYNDRTGKMECLYILQLGLFNCFKCCIDTSVKSVAFAAIGTGYCGIPEKLCCLVYAGALLKIDEYCRLKQMHLQIYFVDISEKILTSISKYFKDAFRRGYESVTNEISYEVEKKFEITLHNIREGLQVKAYKGDISVFREGSILCAVTKTLSPVGRDTVRIVHKAGASYSQKLQVLRRARTYQEGHVAETDAGDISTHLVLHCIIPSMRKCFIRRKHHYRRKLKDCYSNAFQRAKEQGKTVIALSVLGLDCDYLDKDLCCSALQKALRRESSDRGTSLKQIHIVYKEDDALSHIRTLLSNI